MLSLGVLTAGIGAVVQDHAASANARRVATGVNAALAPVASTGPHRGRVAFTDGRLHTAERDLRVLNESGVIRRVRIDALVYESGTRRVAFVGGAITRGPVGSETLVEPPPITAGEEVLVVGAPRLGGTGAVAGRDVDAVLRTNVTHERSRLGRGHYRVAIETAAPDPLARHFEARGIDVTRRDLDDDGVTSVVADFTGQRVGYLVVHDLDLEVRHG
ncbi:MAG: type IV pilin [Haloplanus sp.]